MKIYALCDRWREVFHALQATTLCVCAGMSAVMEG